MKRSDKKILIIICCLLTLALAGCILYPSVSTIRVNARVIQNGSSAEARIAISRLGFPVLDAAVTVNGDFCFQADGLYTASLPTLNPGDTVTLSIQVPGTDIAVTSSLILPSAPPVDPDQLAAAPALTIPVRTALEVAAPDRIEIEASGEMTGDGSSFTAEFPGSSSILSLPANVLSGFQATPAVTVTAVSGGDLEGNVFEPGSSFTVENGEIVTLPGS